LNDVLPPGPTDVNERHFTLTRPEIYVTWTRIRPSTMNASKDLCVLWRTQSVSSENIRLSPCRQK